ncbi:hypothetical protein [Candidatus Poriferisodalis sp.]|uniref:hypothetical protein n=1 Tax=Candidatus Poriferisodalis sp. TaxID=3101277 RepID=UPI003B010CAC
MDIYGEAEHIAADTNRRLADAQMQATTPATPGGDGERALAFPSAMFTDVP